MESTPRPGLTRRAFFAALLAPFLARFAKWLPKPSAPAPSSPTTIGFSAGQVLRLGDQFTIAGYYAVNPRTLEPTAVLKRFVVAAVDTKRRQISFVPAAIERGQYQNVARAAA